MQQYSEAVITCHLAHQSHDEHIVVYCKVTFLEDRSQLELVGSYFVVAGLDRDSEFQRFDFQLLHKGCHTRRKSGFVGEQELEKVKNKFESTQIFGNINYLNVATNLAWFELTGQAEDIDREVDNYRSVTAEQLHRVAQQTFRDENGIVLYYQKENL